MFGEMHSFKNRIKCKVIHEERSYSVYSKIWGENILEIRTKIFSGQWINNMSFSCIVVQTLKEKDIANKIKEQIYFSHLLGYTGTSPSFADQCSILMLMN